jgi:hypothetical protein
MLVSGIQPVLFANRDRPDRILDWVVADRLIAACGITQLGRPTFRAVVDRLGNTAVLGQRAVQQVVGPDDHYS